MPQVLLAASPPPEPIPISLYSGQGLVPAEELAMEPDRVARFIHVYEGGREHLLPQTAGGARPLGSIRVRRPGEHLVVVDYGAPVAGGPGQPGRRQDRHFLKALVYAGPTRDAVFRRELGQTLEIIPLLDPTMVVGGPLPVGVRFRAAPLAGARVTLVSRMGARIARARATTGPDGTASLRVPAEGVHLIQAVHVVPCTGCVGVEWEAFHAAYTFANGPLVVSGTVTAPSTLEQGVGEPEPDSPAERAPELPPPGAEPPPAQDGDRPADRGPEGAASAESSSEPRAASGPGPARESGAWPALAGALAAAAAAAIGLLLRRA